MDEAHRARTPLSFETLARFNPSCIVELTATPETDNEPERERFASNVLYQVSAAALKEAQMIKLPVELRVQHDWQQLLSDAIAKLNELTALAIGQEGRGGEYLRPIMLLQAQPRREGRQTLTADVLKQSLMTDFQIPAGCDRDCNGGCARVGGDRPEEPHLSDPVHHYSAGIARGVGLLVCVCSIYGGREPVVAGGGAVAGAGAADAGGGEAR